MSPNRGLSSKATLSQDMKRGLSPSGAQSAGADTLQVQDPAYHRSVTSHSATSQDSAYISCCGSAEDLWDPKDRSGTKHTDLPQQLDSAEYEQGEDDSLLEQSESCPRDGIGEEPQDPQDGAATKGTALLQVQDPGGHKLRDFIWESETRPRKEEAVVEIPEDALGPQDGSATKGTELPQVQDPAGHRQGEAAALLEQRESCPGDGNGEESQDGSAPRNKQKRTFQECLEEWIRSHPRLTLALLVLLLLLAVVFGLSLAAVSVTRRRETPVTPVTPVTPGTPQLLACPKGWVGYRGFCYFLSKDEGGWDQAQAWCSELGASLAIPKDMDMELLFRLTGNIDHWLGLRRQDQGLQWVDGSSFSSSVEVLGDGECVFLSNGKFWSGSCSNPRPYLCSKPQSSL